MTTNIRPVSSGPTVDELFFAHAAATPGCSTGQSIRVSLDHTDTPILKLGAATAYITDTSTLRDLASALLAAADRADQTYQPQAS
jgi:hypothetical protein